MAEAEVGFLRTQLHSYKVFLLPPSVKKKVTGPTKIRGKVKEVAPLNGKSGKDFVVIFNVPHTFSLSPSDLGQSP